VNLPDLETEFFDRFRDAAGCTALEDGALIRGLGKVTTKREKTYRSGAGERYTLTEYKVPPPNTVVDMAAAKAKRT
jgi:hypothetical protein